MTIEALKIATSTRHQLLKKLFGAWKVDATIDNATYRNPKTG